MSKARDGANTLLTIGTTLAAKAPIASPVFTGNVGVGSALLTTTASNMLQLGSTSNLSWYNQGDDELDISVNAINNSGNKYIETKAASQYIQQAGAHLFRVAASGTAGAAISFSNSLSLTSDGRGLSAYTAKAWVNLNGTGTPAIRSSHNISSVTDNGTGDYIPVFAVAMSNANYAAVANGGAVNNWRGTETTVITISTANFRIYHVEDNTTYDPDFITAIVFGI